MSCRWTIKRHWFRYHHLFADVLAAHALQEQPAQVPLWHQRASAWYAENGLPADAIRHALAAKDFARAAGLVELAWPAMDGRFQAAAWLGWAQALPDELVRARPVLSVAYAWALLNGGELEAAEARLGDAERRLDSAAARSAQPDAPATAIIVVDEAQLRTLPASIATAHTYLAQARGDLPGAVAYGQRALDLLPAGDHLRRGPAAALLGLAQWASGDLEAAYRALADAMAGFQQVGSLHFAISVTSGLADIRTVQGRLREAVKIYAQALELALAQGEPLLRGTADLYLGLSELVREQGDLDSRQPAPAAQRGTGRTSWVAGLALSLLPCPGTLQGDPGRPGRRARPARRGRTPLYQDAPPRRASPRRLADAGVGGTGPVERSAAVGAGTGLVCRR